MEHNLAHERKSGVRIDEHAYEKIEGRLVDLFALLRQASEAVRNLGDWLIRVQHDLMRRMLGPDADAIVFLPMAELTDLFRDELARIARSTDRVQQSEASLFWIYCPSCFRRTRVTLPVGMTIEHVCGACAHRQTLTEPELWRWLMPDIVAYEAGLFRLGIDGWVVGSPASYHPQIDAAYRGAFGLDAPPRFVLASVPTFTGLGEPPEGFGKTRLLRALLEVEPNDFAKRLSAPWDESPRIVSEFLAPQQ